MIRKVIYPGTFDPITFGHIDIIERCSKLFDEVIVAAAENKDKNPLFSLDERRDLISKSISYDNVRIDSFNGLLVDYARSCGVNTVVRGIRAYSDFEYEFQMALTNRKIADDIETIFMMPKEEYSYISSKNIKEICKLGGEVNLFVPRAVEEALKGKL